MIRKHLKEIVLEYQGQKITINEDLPNTSKKISGEGFEIYLYAHSKIDEGKGVVVISDKEIKGIETTIENMCENGIMYAEASEIGNRIKADDYMMTYIDWMGSADDRTIVRQKGFSKGKTSLQNSSNHQEAIKELRVVEEDINEYASATNFEYTSPLRNNSPTSVLIKPEFGVVGETIKTTDTRTLKKEAEALVTGKWFEDSEGREYEYKLEPGIVPGTVIQDLSDLAGVIFKARRKYKDGTESKPVAVRLFSNIPKGKDGSNARRIIKREIALLQASISEPSIVDIYESSSMDGYLYYEMEFKTPLSDELIYLNDKEELIEIVKKICKGADYLFNGIKIFGDSAKEDLTKVVRQAIVHRDIKPSNVLIERTEKGLEVKLTDFGLAKATVALGDFTNSQSMRNLAENFNFAPELFLAGKKEFYIPRDRVALQKVKSKLADQCTRNEKVRYDERTDVYGIGATLYQMLAGGTTRTSVKDFPEAYHKLDESLIRGIRIPQKRIEELNLTSDEVKFLENVVKKCMNPLPKGEMVGETEIGGRYSSAKELHELLETEWVLISTRPERRQKLRNKAEVIKSKIEEVKNQGNGALLDEFLGGSVRESIEEFVQSYKESREELGELEEDINTFILEDIGETAKELFEIVECKNFIRGEYCSEEYTVDQEMDRGVEKRKKDMESLIKTIDMFRPTKEEIKKQSIINRILRWFSREKA